MSTKESKFYVLNFIDTRIILTPRVMKTYIPKSYKEGKWEGRRSVERL